MKAIVIGGGIGGLTAGVALDRKGWDVTVLERTPKLEPVGSGLAIAVNALRALDTVGLGDPVRARARMQGQIGIRRPDGRWLTHTSGSAAEERYGDRTAVVLLRAQLVDLLAEALGPDRLRLGTTVTGVDAATGTVRTDAGEFTGDLVVAADGIHSPTRRALFPGHPGPVYSGGDGLARPGAHAGRASAQQRDLGPGAGVRRAPAGREDGVLLRHRRRARRRRRR
ncbi:FAD-dependent oxidoreductase [Nonomuraea ferruginea]